MKGERVKVKGERDGSSIEEGIKGGCALFIRSKVVLTSRFLPVERPSTYLKPPLDPFTFYLFTYIGRVSFNTLPRRTCLSLQGHEFCENFIRCGDDLGICLESPLRRDHVDEFRSKVHVRQLQGAWPDEPHSLIPRRSDDYRAGSGGLGIHILADGLEIRGAGEIGYCDLPQG